MPNETNKQKAQRLIEGFAHAIASLQPYQGSDQQVSGTVNFLQSVKAEIEAELAPPAQAEPEMESGAPEEENDSVS